MLGEDYRVVNYNVWKYWLLVYGGGPSIGRASKDIYGLPAIGHSSTSYATNACCYVSRVCWSVVRCASLFLVLVLVMITGFNRCRQQFLGEEATQPSE